jgi:hypothetical protein
MEKIISIISVVCDCFGALVIIVGLVFSKKSVLCFRTYRKIWHYRKRLIEDVKEILSIDFKGNIKQLCQSKATNIIDGEESNTALELDWLSSCVFDESNNGDSITYGNISEKMDKNLLDRICDVYKKQAAELKVSNIFGNIQPTLQSEQVLFQKISDYLFALSRVKNEKFGLTKIVTRDLNDKFNQYPIQTSSEPNRIELCLPELEGIRENDIDKSIVPFLNISESIISYRKILSYPKFSYSNANPNCDIYVQNLEEARSETQRNFFKLCDNDKEDVNAKTLILKELSKSRSYNGILPKYIASQIEIDSRSGIARIHFFIKEISYSAVLALRAKSLSAMEEKVRIMNTGEFEEYKKANVIRVSCLIISKDGYIILPKRSDEAQSSRGQYCASVSGNLDIPDPLFKNDDADRYGFPDFKGAIQREGKEELNIKVKKEDITFLGISREYTKDDNGSYMLCSYAHVNYSLTKILALSRSAISSDGGWELGDEFLVLKESELDNIKYDYENSDNNIDLLDLIFYASIVHESSEPSPSEKARKQYIDLFTQSTIACLYYFILAKGKIPINLFQNYINSQEKEIMCEIRKYLNSWKQEKLKITILSNKVSKGI